MRTIYAGHPIPLALLIGSIVAWSAGEVRQSLRRRAEATNRDRFSIFVLRLCVGAAILSAASAMLLRAAAFAYSPAVLACSLCLIWAGLGLRLWCFRTLGHYFTLTVMTSAGQPVIAAGPYRVLRHPSYTAVLLFLAGIGVTFGNWLSLAAMVVFPLLGLLIRIRVEEAALTVALGSAYTTYARSRKRLIPFVW